MQVETYHYEYINKKQDSFEKPKLDQCIDKIIQKEGYVSCDVKKTAISTDGGNYLGNLYEIDVKGKTVDGEKETSIFVKAKAPDAIDLEILSLDDVYNKEHFFYVELSKVFDELQNEADVPMTEKFQTVKSYEESYSEAIILENLTKKGYKTWFRMDCSTLNMAEICIKQLAKFHALSFVIKDRKTEYFDNKIKNLNIPMVFDTQAWDDFNNKFYNIAIEYLDGDMRRKVEGKMPDLLKKHAQMYTNEVSRCCLCHGDYRLNNIMVKEEEGLIKEAIPVDYQLIHYGNPMIDFLYFMYTGTDYQFRRIHMANLKDLYYKTMETFLKYFDISMESVMPRKSFEQMYSDIRYYGLMVSVLYVPFIFVSEGEAPDLTKELVGNVEFSMDDRFRERFVGAIQEFIDVGYL